MDHRFSLETSENDLVPSKLKHPGQFDFLRWPPPYPATEDHERLRFKRLQEAQPPVTAQIYLDRDNHGTVGSPMRKVQKPPFGKLNRNWRTGERDRVGYDSRNQQIDVRSQLMSQGPSSPQGAERALMVGEDHINFKLIAWIILRRSACGYGALTKLHGATVDVVAHKHNPLLT
jgi:hypothetical protein